MTLHALKFAVSAGLLAIVLWLAGAQHVMTHLQGAEIGWLADAFATLTLLTFLMARRWQLTAHALSIELGYRHAVAEYYIPQLVNLILPGGVVRDVGRAVRLRQKGDMSGQHNLLPPNVCLGREQSL
ncbi:lysylphosphatidylglycerol synthase domain-containing protein [Yoonia sediminilitoris]|uniref:Lysylphosphatidylglycerol synthase-like protein n=1 Tax=Yoonia sediminilitoris TaxID=1286148 RepID=A0A2T6KRQ3_9RHOB|nr:lysylphosphatidylglycerol synthase domain-containing protein [Yoonia sediminilitoris]PUB19239.1 lysylphosphatidylglycerol synthase-like protein [Yoonia sediminilitoris]RCW99407.1 lysylphosphatidylglycerol synthase-like protein [Yoonia sediminilitoris]